MFLVYDIHILITRIIYKCILYIKGGLAEQTNAAIDG